MKKRLQVFVSSTYTDLIPERQAAVSAILKAGHIPAGMELFTAGDRSQMETIKQWIDESDVYMLILGGRYGSVEAATGVSYTELEYDYAVGQSKPFFAVVITDGALNEKVKKEGVLCIEKENPKSLVAFREKVLSNISSFFDDVKDIRLCVHESLADFSANRSLKGWVSGDEIVDTKPFFDEISKLAEENKMLKSQLSELGRKASSRVNEVDERLKEIRDTLGSIELDLPSEVVQSGIGYKSNILNIFHTGSDIFANGVSNAETDSKTQHFLYFNVCPKLQVHGLMVNETVAGARYRRYAMTDLGNALLAQLQKERISKQTMGADIASGEHASEEKVASAAKEKPAAKKKPPSRDK